jgi:site-specific recombinase XerD
LKSDNDLDPAGLMIRLSTYGLSFTIPHEAAKMRYTCRPDQRVGAMRKTQSPDKSPHVAARDYLRPHEANAVIEAAGRVGRQRLRDQVLLRLMYRHGLRASEARHTKWTDFDLTPGSGSKTFHVRRLKGSHDSVHTLDRDEVSALRRLNADSTSPFLFVSERGGPLSPDMIARIVERAGAAAKLRFHAHPHMLRHATGYALATEGTDTRLIQDLAALRVR